METIKINKKDYERQCDLFNEALEKIEELSYLKDNKKTIEDQSKEIQLYSNKIKDLEEEIKQLKSKRHKEENKKDDDLTKIIIECIGSDLFSDGSLNMPQNEWYNE